MGVVKMYETIGCLRSAYCAETGYAPTAIRLHYDDWCCLLQECSPHLGFVNSEKATSFMGMTPLLDGKWPVGFPVCLNRQGASQAIEEGARRA